MKERKKRTNAIISDSVIKDCSSQKYIVEVYDTVIITNNFAICDCKAEITISNCDI